MLFSCNILVHSIIRHSCGLSRCWCTETMLYKKRKSLWTWFFYSYFWCNLEGIKHNQLCVWIWICESVIYWELRTENLVSKHLTAKEPKRALYFCLSRAIPTQTCPIWQITSDFVCCETWMSQNFGRINFDEIIAHNTYEKQEEGKKWEVQKICQRSKIEISFLSEVFANLNRIN